ncbi:hypothetical protein [Streptomyces cucumeris]|nr:hypothetical protein [Streptomyces sp. NEAU-Y11]
MNTHEELVQRIKMAHPEDAAMAMIALLDRVVNDVRRESLEGEG